MKKETNKFINFKNLAEWARDSEYCDILEMWIEEYDGKTATKISLRIYTNGVIMLDDCDNFMGFVSFDEKCKSFSKHILKSFKINYRIRGVNISVIDSVEQEGNSFMFNLNDYSYDPQELS